MTEILMPKMGFDMQEGTIVRWLKKVGDDVKKGEMVAEIETDKVTIEIESFASGKLTRIIAGEGQAVPVNSAIAELDGPTAGDAAPAPDAAPAADVPTPAPAAAPTAGDAATPQLAEAASASPQDNAAAVQPAQNPIAVGEVGDAGKGLTEPSTSVAPRDGTAQASAPAPQNGQAAAPANGHIIASPIAKRIASEQNVTLSTVQGSGPGGRIVRRDVESAVQQRASQPAPTAPQAAAPAPVAAPAPQATPAPQAAPAPQATPAPQAAPAPQPAPANERTHREPLSRLRQTIARRLVQSKGPVPHFYVTTEIDMGAVVALRKQINTATEGRITINDFIVKAVALTLKQFPTLNASFAEDALEYHDYINVSIAVATDNGLLAPAVTDVDKKALGTISAEAKEMIERTRVGKATPDELGRGTFSVSNLGMFPVDSFVAIINPPQSAIVAVGAVTETPVVRDGQIVIAQVMKATISVDHRVADGAVAAQFMQALKKTLENPLLILV